MAFNHLTISHLSKYGPTFNGTPNIRNLLTIKHLAATPFTFPFCYTPRPEIIAAARRLIARIDGDPVLRALFAEGKMLGVLMVERREPDKTDDASDGGAVDFLYAFSGLAGGRNRIEGFVPPIYDLLDPDGHFT